jgi:alkanesulfonate monooxygenase SsuD/methylene tetrahydromethanopterin reductase-like flavin-dependent oxidoreductase (luciferase family)
MRVFTGLPNDDLNAVPATVVALETAGYDGVSVAENSHNPFLPLAVAAVTSRRLRLETGVAIAFPRSPMMTANMGWDLQAASGGRFVLGLGSQVRPTTSVDSRRPGRRRHHECESTSGPSEPSGTAG